MGSLFDINLDHNNFPTKTRLPVGEGCLLVRDMLGYAILVDFSNVGGKLKLVKTETGLPYDVKRIMAWQLLWMTRRG